MAVGITAALCLALTLFAFQTKWDFTVMGGMLCCFLMALLVFGKDTLLAIQLTIYTIVESSIPWCSFSCHVDNGLQNNRSKSQFITLTTNVTPPRKRVSEAFQ